jgi:tetratricopeptide (TPR) repeat protein
VTHRATDRAIEYREPESIPAKGKAQPVEAWEAVAPRSRLGVDVAHHGAAELVGRELELRALSDALERARGAGSMQHVTLVGAPGMGKSRLVWELLHQIEGELEFTHWRQGRALSYGGGAFGAVAEAVRAQIGMLESDTPDEVAERLRAALDALPLDEGERGWVEARLRPLVGLESAEAASREESFVAWRKLFEAIAEISPLVLVLEDLHWADEGTLEFVEHLLDWSADTPLLVLCTARPELLERRPTWGGGRLNSNTIALTPLSDDATALLLARLLDSPVLDADVQSRLLLQAGGNPLYAEEYARMHDQGGGAGLPDTVQGVIAARLDRLDAVEKELLQTASVLGKVFWSGGVGALGGGDDLDERLQQLVRREFLRRERSSSMTGETEYAFRHALVRDVAYAQLPRAARAHKHRAAAEWISAVAAHRPDLVAYHYAESLELLRASGGDVAAIERPARLAFRSAGDQARTLGALDDAQAHYRRAIGLWPDDEELPRLWAVLAEAELDANPAEAHVSAMTALHLFTARNDFEGVAWVEGVMSSTSWSLGDGAGARAHVDRSVASAERSGSRSALARAMSDQCRLLMVSSLNEEAIAIGTQAIALAQAEGLVDAAINARIAVGSAAGNIGRDGWEDQLIEATARARAANNAAAVERALNNRANCLRVLHGFADSVPIYDEMEAHVRQFPLPHGVRWAEAIIGWIRYVLGSWDEALSRADRFFAIDRETPHYLDTQVHVIYSSIAFARGDRAVFDERTALAVQRAREVGDPQQVGPILAHSAWLLLQDGRDAAARLLVDEVLAYGSEAVDEAVNYGLVGWLAVDFEPRLRGAASGTFAAGIADAIAAGRFEHVVAELDRTAAATDAAYARLRLAGRLLDAGEDPEPWLSEAESFYRGVGAMRYLREIDELRATRRSA